MKVTSLIGTIPLMCLVCSSHAQAQVSFFQPPTFAGGGTGLFVADFNGDGRPDILRSDGTMSLGNGDGTFKAGPAVLGSPLAVADFNGDGRPDILQQGTGTLLVLLGNGDGTFQSAKSTSSGASLSAIAATDLNGDGKADCIGVFNGAGVVYLSNGDGTFAPGVSYSLGLASGEYVAVSSLGDFNGDHKTDIVFSTQADNLPGREIVLLGNGDGSFQTTAISSTGTAYPSYVAEGDF